MTMDLYGHLIDANLWAAGIPTESSDAVSDEKLPMKMSGRKAHRSEAARFGVLTWHPKP